MTNYAWKCVACSKSYRSSKNHGGLPACPACGELLVAITPVPQPQTRSSSSSSSTSSRHHAARRSPRPSDPQQAMALVAPSSAWVPDPEPGLSPDAVAFHVNPSSSRFTHAIPSPAVAATPAPAAQTFPWIWVSVGGVAVMITIFIAFLAARSHPATVAATTPMAQTLPAKFDVPPAAVLPRPSPITIHRTINLLMLVDPARDAHSGTWTLQAGSNPELTSDATQHARLNIPYQPPEEYDFRVDFTRISGDNCMTQIFTHQKSACLVVYGWKGTVTGFQQIDGRSADHNPTGVRGLATENGQRHTSVVKVRKNSLEAWLDGQLITRYETDGTNMEAKDWAIERPLGIGTQLSPTIFHTIELTEISGPGRALN